MKKNNVSLLISFFFLFWLCIPQNIAYPTFNKVIMAIDVLGMCWSIFTFIYFGLFKNKKLWVILIWITWALLSTICNRTDIWKCFKMIGPIFACVVLVQYMSIIDAKTSLKYLAYLFLFIMTVQFFSLITHCFGYSNDQVIDNRYNYFLGIRIRISTVLIFAIAITLLYVVMEEKKKIIFNLTLTFSIYFVVYERVSTGIMGCIIFFIILGGSKIIKNRRFWKFVIIVLSIFAVGFNLWGTSNSFSWLIRKLLNENIGGRVIMWRQALDKTKGIHVLFGNGYGHKYIFSVGNFFRASTSHSQYLDIFFCFGIIGLIIYFWMLFEQVSIVRELKSKKAQEIVIATIISLLFIGIPTTTFRTVYMYICYALLVNLSHIENSKEIYTRNINHQRAGRLRLVLKMR